MKTVSSYSSLLLKYSSFPRWKQPEFCESKAWSKITLQRKIKEKREVSAPQIVNAIWVK